ncbi:lipoprotein [Klebsiella oxytoca]|nr:lipoprotein [Klebsiella oxytoca]
MKLMTRIALTAALATGFSMAAQAADVKAAPAPAQDPIVQHLKLTNDQITKIKSLHQQLEKTFSRFPRKILKTACCLRLLILENGTKRRSKISWRHLAR